MKYLSTRPGHMPAHQPFVFQETPNNTDIKRINIKPEWSEKLNEQVENALNMYKLESQLEFYLMNENTKPFITKVDPETLPKGATSRYKIESNSYSANDFERTTITFYTGSEMLAVITFSEEFIIPGGNQIDINETQSVIGTQTIRKYTVLKNDLWYETNSVNGKAQNIVVEKVGEDLQRFVEPNMVGTRKTKEEIKNSYMMWEDRVLGALDARAQESDQTDGAKPKSNKS